VDYTGTNECCGMGFAAAGPNAGAEALRSILERMAEAGTSWIVTPCPSCFTQLESGQRQNKDLRPMPVLHVAELCALAFGRDEETLGLKHHRVPFQEKPAKV
jgi:heterodisulfide reductase subunit B